MQYGGRVAFLSFRWDVEEDVAIMYVYELFVEKCMRGRGIARALMLYAEDICDKVGVFRIMLTVFSGNEAAMKLYGQGLQ